MRIIKARLSENSTKCGHQRSMFTYVVFVITLMLMVSCVAIDDLDKAPAEDKDSLKAELLPPCQACKKLTDSFKKGIDRTSRYKFDGGDAAWEEKKQGKYAESEVRLTEVEEDLCKDVIRGQNQCHQLASDNEEHFEQWWFNEQKQNSDIFDWFCIKKTLVCCEENTFGPQCEQCPGGVENPCSGNGRCRGAGLRNGPGDCRCFKGYSGKACDECSSGFYQSSHDDSERITCVACHAACKGDCLDETPNGCEECWDGWFKHPELGCQDIDECFTTTSLCAKNEFCANTEGSYRCIECYSSCASCSGDGPDECTDCKEGYTRQGKMCIDSAVWWRSLHTQWGRYLTYLGLCIATCIIFNKSTAVASVVGVAVATYIGVSEYVVSKDLDGDSPAVRFFPVPTA